MDKRLELNEKQKALVENYKALCKEMKDANIMAVYRLHELYLINGEHVTDIDFTDNIEMEDEECGEIIEVKFDELPCYDYPYNFGMGYNEDDFAVIVK